MSNLKIASLFLTLAQLRDELSPHQATISHSNCLGVVSAAEQNLMVLVRPRGWAMGLALPHSTRAAGRWEDKLKAAGTYWLFRKPGSEMGGFARAALCLS